MTLRWRKDVPAFASYDVVVPRPDQPALPAHIARPAHPERICWGCDHYCPADDLRCGNEVVRAMHPVEIFGPDWCLEPQQREED